MSGLIWIQTVWHSDGISERIFQKSWFWKKSADDICLLFVVACRAWSGSKLFDTLIAFLKEFFEKVYFEKRQQTTFVYFLLLPVGPDLDLNCLTLRWHFWKNFSRKFILKKRSRQHLFIVCCLFFSDCSADIFEETDLCSVFCTLPIIIEPDFDTSLTLNAPIATKFVCFSRLLKCLKSLNDKQCGPRSDCSYRSSLFWVHTVCFKT